MWGASLVTKGIQHPHPESDTPVIGVDAGPYMGAQLGTSYSLGEEVPVKTDGNAIYICRMRTEIVTYMMVTSASYDGDMTGI